MRRAATAVVLGCALAASLHAQRGGPPPPVQPRAAAPIDLTGYWVSLVTEDWRYRMATPPKGDYGGVPLSPAGRQAAAAWDPTRATGADERCKPFGAGGIMRMPTRLHITWTSDETLTIETDAGAQTRVVPFRTPRTEGGTWQGVSVASWDRSETAMGRGGFFPGPVLRGGSLKVVTTNMKPGYLTRNGAPYSAQATLTEYFDRFDVPDGDPLLLVSSEIVDPVYLSQPYWTSSHFRKQRDASGWNPRACE